MKKIVLFLFMLPCILFSQVQDPCSNSIIDYLTDHENANKPISYQLSQGWNMVGYYGTAQNNEMSTQINEESLSDASTIEETFQVIKNVSGQFWSPQFSQLNTLTPGEGYMMYVITDSPPAISFNAQFQMPQISGCTNCLAENFRPIATVDDGSCLILGCTSDWADNYNLEATVDDGSCYKYGCTGIGADNYDALATTNDGSCLFPIGCTEQWADNYNSYAVTDDGSCYRVGCDDQTADNYDAIATVINNNNCVYSISIDDFSAQMPVTDNNMSVVFPAGTLNDYVGGAMMTFIDGQPVSYSGSWNVIVEDGAWGASVIGSQPENTDFGIPSIFGANPGEALSFAILMDDQTIVHVDLAPPVTYAPNTFEMVSDNFLSFSIDGAPVVFGCTNSDYLEYSGANLDDGSCSDSIVKGCMDSNACTFDNHANVDDGSCIYPEEGYDCGSICLNDCDADGICDFEEVAGCTDPTAFNYNPSATGASCTGGDTWCVPVIVGCMNPAAFNFDSAANIPNNDLCYY